MFFRRYFLFSVFALLTFFSSMGQEKDSTEGGIMENELAKRIVKAVTTRRPLNDEGVSFRSEDLFMPHRGKIIRKVYVRQFGFERSIYDTARSIKNTITRVADALHADTREEVIRENLFFRSGREVNPWLLADNERYLRDLDFILDSKIVIHPVRGSRDSVDIEVITRDVFTLGVRARARGVDEFSVGIYEANLLGMGQRVQSEFLFEGTRAPIVGKGFLYRKMSLGGSLVNVSAGYTELDNARSAGEENEYAWYLRLDRPLVSPYSRMAGGLELSKNWSVNVNRSPDSLFRRYTYNAREAWIGYNIGVRNNMENRSRHFIALRYYRQDFERQPDQEVQRLRRIYNNQEFVLGEVTFYNQNFYKTSYVYGFGRTEDIPYGQTINITAGWAQELGLRRFYAGGYAIRRIVRPSGRFYDLELGTGAFFSGSEVGDGVVYGNGTFYSKLYSIGKSRVRHQFAGGFARAFNNQVRELLTIHGEIQGFRPDSLYAFQRVHLRSETTVFTPLSVAGFRFAPFVSLEGAFVKRDVLQEVKKDFFVGGTGGLRIRNENLIFGTVEFRAFYYPKTVPGVETLSFRVTTNVRIKYSGSFVRAPDFVTYN